MPNPLDPSKLAESGSEHAHQVALFCKMSQNFNQYPCLRLAYAIPNGGKRDKITAANLKAEGVKAGMLDICLPWPIGSWHGLYIELKVDNNKPTKEQNWYIDELRKAGYGALWVVGWESAWDTILAYLNWKE